jgi:hypothetical protein
MKAARAAIVAIAAMPAAGAALADAPLFSGSLQQAVAPPSGCRPRHKK